MLMSAFLQGVKGRHEFKITYSTLKNARLTIHEALIMLKQAVREREEALIGDASGSGMSGLFVSRASQPAGVPWEEANPL